MADGVIKAILPSTPVHSSNSSVTNPLTQLLQIGQSVNLQVLKALSAHDVLFQGKGFQLTLHLEEGASFKPGSEWVFQSEQHGKSFILKPENGVAGGRHIIVRHGEQLEELATRDANQNRPSAAKSEGGQTKSSSIQSFLKASPNKAALQSPVNDIKIEQAIQFHRQDAATKQNSFAKIFSALPEIAAGRSSVINTLPEGKEIQKLAQRILGLRLTSGLTASGVKAAVQSSGIFHDAQEALLLSSGSNAKAQGGGQIQGSNLKQELLILQNFLVRAGGRPHVASHIAKGDVPILPERDAALHGQKPVLPITHEQAGSSFLNSLIDQAVEGLARMKLLQLSSIPQNEADYMQAGDKARVQLNLEIPVALNQDQTAIVSMRISQDDQGGGEYAGEHGHSWSIDLAMDTEETGPIDAQIKFTAKGIRIILWAGDKDFSSQLQESSERLNAGLAEEGLEVDSIKILSGSRPDLMRYFQQQSGRYLDHSL